MARATRPVDAQQKANAVVARRHKRRTRLTATAEYRAAVARVRERTDLVALVRETIPLLPNKHTKGRTFVGRCPSHEAMGLHVDPASDPPHFVCFGALTTNCEGISGDALDWVILMKGVEFDDALRMLAKRVRVRVPDRILVPSPPLKKPKPPRWAAWVDTIRNRDVRIAMHEALHARDDALRLGADRGPPIAKAVFFNAEATLRKVRREIAAGRAPRERAVDLIVMFIAAGKRAWERQAAGEDMMSADTIEAVRDATDIAAVAIGEHVRLEPRWRSIVGRCPFCMTEPEPVEAHGYHDGFHVIPERPRLLYLLQLQGVGRRDRFRHRARDRVTFAEALDRLGERAGIEVVWECGPSILVSPPRPLRLTRQPSEGHERRSAFRKFGRRP